MTYNEFAQQEYASAVAWFSIGLTCVIILACTKWRKWESFPQAAITVFVVPPIIIILLDAIIKGNTRENDFWYTIDNGKCKMCGCEAFIEIEDNTTRGSKDNLYTSISCNCEWRHHGNNWCHFDKVYPIFKRLKNWENEPYIKHEREDYGEYRDRKEFLLDPNTENKNYEAAKKYDIPPGFRSDFVDIDMTITKR